MMWRCDLEPQAERYASDLLDLTRQVLGSSRYLLASRLQEFERDFAEYIGVQHCIGVANGTDAIILALRASGLEYGAEVITTPFTAIPTISAIVAAGGTPVFVDIEPDTYLIDIKRIPDALNDRTGAIVPVHLFTQMVDTEQLRNLLPRTVTIIEDAAQAHGCRLRSRMAGTLGEMAAFSFYPSKNLGGYGDSGAVVTDSDDFCEKLRLIRNYGQDSEGRIVTNGVNSRMDELQAAYLGLKLPDLELMNERRRELASLYSEQLEGLPVKVPVIAEDALPNYHVYVIEVEEGRDALRACLSAQEVQTDVFYPVPHHLQPAYVHLGYAPGDFPVAETTASRVLALPMYYELEDDQVRHVAAAIRKFYGRD